MKDLNIEIVNYCEQNGIKYFITINGKFFRPDIVFMFKDRRFRIVDYQSYYFDVEKVKHELFVNLLQPEDKEEKENDFCQWYKKKYDPIGYLYPGKPMKDISFQKMCERVEEYIFEINGDRFEKWEDE